MEGRSVVSFLSRLIRFAVTADPVLCHGRSGSLPKPIRFRGPLGTRPRRCPARGVPAAPRLAQGLGWRLPAGGMYVDGWAMGTDGRIGRSRELYDRFVFQGDAGALTVAERELESVRADLALARGRIRHGRFLERAGPEDPRAGIVRGGAAALPAARRGRRAVLDRDRAPGRAPGQRRRDPGVRAVVRAGGPDRRPERSDATSVDSRSQGNICCLR